MRTRTANHGRENRQIRHKLEKVRIRFLSLLNERHLRRVLAEYVTYFNHWRPHRSLGQRAPCAQAPPWCASNWNGAGVIARSVLGGVHRVYDLAA